MYCSFACGIKPLFPYLCRLSKNAEAAPERLLRVSPTVEQVLYYLSNIRTAFIGPFDQSLRVPFTELMLRRHMLGICRMLALSHVVRRFSKAFRPFRPPFLAIRPLILESAKKWPN